MDNLLQGTLSALKCDSCLAFVMRIIIGTTRRKTQVISDLIRGLRCLLDFFHQLFAIIDLFTLSGNHLFTLPLCCWWVFFLF